MKRILVNTLVLLSLLLSISSAAMWRLSVLRVVVFRWTLEGTHATLVASSHGRLFWMSGEWAPEYAERLSEVSNQLSSMRLYTFAECGAIQMLRNLGDTDWSCIADVGAASSSWYLLGFEHLHGPMPESSSGVKSFECWAIPYRFLTLGGAVAPAVYLWRRSRKWLMRRPSVRAAFAGSRPLNIWLFLLLLAPLTLVSAAYILSRFEQVVLFERAVVPTSYWRVRASDHGVECIHYRSVPLGGGWASRATREVGWNWDWRILGLGSETLPTIGRFAPSCTAHAFAMDFWLLFLLTSPPLLYPFVRWRRQAYRQRHGLCLRCGYDLRMTPARCPECGMIPNAEPEQPPVADDI